VKGPFLAAVGIGALVLYLLGVGSCGSSSGAPTVFAVRFAGTRRGEKVALVSPFGFALGLLATPAASFVGPLGVCASLLKIGSVLFGSGYVLLAFLRSEFVDPGPLTNQQLLDAVAVGQVTPGPVFTTDFSATRRMEVRGGAEGMGSTRTYLEGMVKLLAVLASLPIAQGIIYVAVFPIVLIGFIVFIGATYGKGGDWGEE
jgi:Chromate transporter